jgi:hypothetical protein
MAICKNCLKQFRPNFVRKNVLVSPLGKMATPSSEYILARMLPVPVGYGIECALGQI